MFIYNILFIKIIRNLFRIMFPPLVIKLYLWKQSQIGTIFQQFFYLLKVQIYFYSFVNLNTLFFYINIRNQYLQVSKIKNNVLTCNGICIFGPCTSQFQSNCTCGTNNLAQCNKNQYCLDLTGVNGICFEKCRQNQNICLCGIDFIDICYSSTYCLLQQRGVCMPECTSTNYQNCLILSENQACFDQSDTIYNHVTGKCVPTCKENGETNCFCGSRQNCLDLKLICQSGFECQNVTTGQSVCSEKCTTSKLSSCYCGQGKSQYCNENQTCQDPSQQIGSCKQFLDVIQNDYSSILQGGLFVIICLLIII